MPSPKPPERTRRKMLRELIKFPRLFSFSPMYTTLFDFLEEMEFMSHMERIHHAIKYTFMER